MPATPPREVLLRPTTAADVAWLYGLEVDPESNRSAGTKPRDWPTFEARWAVILADPGAAGVTPRVILADGEPVGSVNISPWEGADAMGYWIAREHWGRGIATRAVGLMLAEFRRRPLFATASAANAASVRVLEKHGFTLVSRVSTPETARTVARETVMMVLR